MGCRLCNASKKMSSMPEGFHEGLQPSAELLSVLVGSKRPTMLSIDIGTSGVRAALFDENGAEIEGAAVRVHRRMAASELTELNADAAVVLVVDTIDSLFARPEFSSSAIEFVSLSCFWHSVLGIDSKATPTTPVLGWADTRAAQAALDLRARLSERTFHQRTGCRFHPSYWPAKLLWLKNNAPEIFRRTKQWLSFSDYLTLQFCGEVLTSISMASATGLFDQRKTIWDVELIRALELTTDSLPAVASHGRTLELTAQFKERWPQLSNARVYPAIGDGAANNIGSGCTDRDRVGLMIGTSGAMRVLFEDEPPDELPWQLWCYRANHVRIVIGGALSDGGALYSWLRQALSLNVADEALDGEIMALEPDAHGLTILPFWAGERSPGWSTNAHGAIMGLTLRTRPIEILRAAMEAVAYRFAAIASALEPIAPGAVIIGSGNALLSLPAWGQIIADVIGRPISLSVTREASTRGAALLALEAAGKINTIQQTNIAVEQTLEPDHSRYRRYREALERQEDAYNKYLDPERSSSIQPGKALNERASAN